MIVFRHIPKTAGTTFRFILANSFGLSHCNTMLAKPLAFDRSELEFARKIFPRLRSIGGHNIPTPTKTFHGSEFLFATFLREPTIRTVSGYQQVIKEGRTTLPFDQWIRNEKFHNEQVRAVAGSDDLDEAKRILRDRYQFVGITEQFAASVRVFQKLCPYRIDPRYMKRRVAPGNGVARDLLSDPSSRRLLQQANERDAELYEYVRGEVFPSLARKAGVDTSEAHPAAAPLRGPFHPNHLLCKWYNKYVYRQIMKFRGAYRKRTGRS